jgi:chemotaxis protein methyltransferase CheR
VRKQVCKRITRRIRDLGLADAEAYRRRLAADAAEWLVLDGLCRVTLSRFYRDKGVFAALAERVLPSLAPGERRLRCWSAGCASGEEAYTLAILWRQTAGRGYPRRSLSIVATDADEAVLRRARAAVYSPGSLKDLPEEWRDAAFRFADGSYVLSPSVRRRVVFRRQDIRRRMPAGPFHLVLCRNLVFTYFDAAERRRTLVRMARRMAAGGVLVVGAHEHVTEAGGLVPVEGLSGFYRKPGGSP